MLCTVSIMCAAWRVLAHSYSVDTNIPRFRKQFTENVQGVSQVTTAFDSAKDIKAPKQSWPNKKFGGKIERLDEKENLRGFGTGADMADEHLDDDMGGEGWFDYAVGLADGVGLYNDFEDDYDDDGNAGSKNAKVGGLGKGVAWKRVAELSVDFRGTPGQEKPELPQGLEVVNSKGVNLKDLKVRVLVGHGPLPYGGQMEATRMLYTF